MLLRMFVFPYIRSSIVFFLGDALYLMACVSYLGKFAQFKFNLSTYWWSRHPDFLCLKQHSFIVRLFRTHCKFRSIYRSLESRSRPFLFKFGTTALAVQDAKICERFPEDPFGCFLVKPRVTALWDCANKNSHLASQ